jgi:hypothetical protein
MCLLVQNSARLRGWILAALLALLSCAAPLGASDASPAKNSAPSSAARADAQLGAQHSSRGAQAPIPDLSQGEPDQGTASFPMTRRPQFGPRHGEGEKAPTVLTGKQRQELLKSDFEKMKLDAAELTKLAQSLQEDLEKSNEHILSMKIMEKAKKIESLAKKISQTAKSY